MALQKNITEVHKGLLANTFFFTLLSISIAFVIPYLSAIKNIKSNFIAKPITAVSVISYSLYLVNGGLIAEKIKHYSNSGEGWSFIQASLIYLFYWFFCLFLSAIIFVLYEKPMTDLRNKFK
jgi:peptidoglycan/LPS O-acetylase OafA/YrhL